jgi:hypothetical protein
MILLTSTSDLLRVTTGQARNVDVHASWVDNLSGAVTPGRTNTLITTATTTTIVGSPASSAQRNVKFVSIRSREASNTVDITVVHSDGTNIPELFKVTLNAQEELIFVEGVGWSVFGADGIAKPKVSAYWMVKVLAADDTGGQNINTVQPWFPTAGGVTIVANTTYYFEGRLYSTRAAGSTSHTTAVQFGGTANVTAIDYEAVCRTGDTNALAASNQFRGTATSALVVKAASTSTTEDTDIEVNGMVRFTTAGTFIPQFIYSVAPGGTPTIKRGSYFILRPFGDNNVTSVGTWA